VLTWREVPCLPVAGGLGPTGGGGPGLPVVRGPGLPVADNAVTLLFAEHWSAFFAWFFTALRLSSALTQAWAGGPVRSRPVRHMMNTRTGRPGTSGAPASR
jgi:hypothetical protein